MGKGKTKTMDWTAVNAVVEAHQSSLIRYANSILRDLERSKDVVQETFVKLCQQDVASIDDHLVPWLFRVTRNHALDALRKEKRMSLYENPETAAGSREQQAASATHEQRKRETIGSVLELVGELPGKQRELVLLKFQQDLSYKEISEVTGMSVSNVGYVLHHAIKELKQRWNALQNV